MKFRFAFNGFFHALRNEFHMKVHVISAILVCLAGVYLGVTKTEWVALVICIGVVLMAEIFNSAIETLCDTLHPDQHPGIGLTKDMAAGGVLLASLASAVVGLVVFVPYVLALFH